MVGFEERRKERRYVVVGMDVLLDGQVCPILDISRSAVRVLKPATLPPIDQPVSLILRRQTRARRHGDAYAVVGRFVRATPMDITFGYDPPRPNWEAIIRRHDTFKRTHLVEV